jgi:hypothetical protein
MTTKIKNKIDAIDITLAQLTEQLELREKVTELLDRTLPVGEFSRVCEAMQFYHFGIENILHESLLEYTFELSHYDRCRDEFFDHHVPCPCEAAYALSKVRKGVR